MSLTSHEILSNSARAFWLLFTLKSTPVSIGFLFAWLFLCRDYHKEKALYI